jgi:hypothetical protein
VIVNPVEMSIEPVFVRDLADDALRHLWKLSGRGAAAAQLHGAADVDGDALARQAESLGREMIRRGLF